ncbi:DUF805 domain-containing protein [Altererythrobacter sp.]|nr:DUF805 domain-containing protein [Altererythrobacter sp.]
MQEASNTGQTRIFSRAIGPLRDYGNFWGRISRKDYWSFVLLFAGLAAIAVLSLYFAGYQFTSVAPGRWDVSLRQDGPGVGSVLAGVFSIGLMLAFAVPLLATAVGRLHDLGRSGWWLLVFFFGDSFFLLVGGTDVWTIIVDIAFVITMSLKGQPEDNRFGPPPDAQQELRASAT